MNERDFRSGAINPIEVYREAWDILKGEYWTIFAATLVGLVIASVVPLIVIGPMMCGIYMVALGKVDGEPARFDKLFKGFEFFLPSFIVVLIIVVPIILFFIAVYVPMLIMTFSGERVSEEELLPMIVSMIVIELIVGVVMTIIHTLVIFAIPLIVDRRLGAIAAMKLSARAVWANKGGIAGLFGVGILVCIGGYLLLCIGIYLAIPVIIMATAVAYRKVFPRVEPKNFDPPPPSAFQGI